METATVRREVEIDTKLADLYEAEVKLLNRLSSAREDLARHAGVKAEYVGKQRVFRGSTESFVETVKAKVADDKTTPWDKRDAEAALTTYDDLATKLAENREAAKPLDAIYDRERWSRFFIVQNVGGHIHSSMHCSTCYATTRFGWLPELSGLTEKDAVDAHGALLCTVCFPTAPVEWTNKYEVEAAEKAAAEADTLCPGSGTWDHDSSGLMYAQRRAVCNHCHQTVSCTSTNKMRKHKKPATATATNDGKGITDTDGAVLKDDTGGEIKTEVSARRELSRALQNEYLYGERNGDKWADYAERLAAAIANKTGESAEELLKVGRVKAEKKIKAEQKKWAR